MTGRVIACAIVKDEPRLAETITAVRATLGDACAGVLIHDTVSAHCPLAPCAGEDWLVSRPFDDFASARNACLDDAEALALNPHTNATWLFMFSGGATFSGFWSVAGSPNAPALVHTERLGKAGYPKCCTVRVGSGLRFAGLTHEVIAVPGGIESLPHCGVVVDYTNDFDPAKKRARWLLDVKLLQNDYTPRGRYYLAQSYDCLGMNPEAFWHYAQRIAMRGYEPERRQAAANAVRIAPTMALAMWAADTCVSAEAELELAERYMSARNVEAARSRAGLALDAFAHGTRSLFPRSDLVHRAKEIIES